MILNLISSPRNISTALMYSFHQRVDMQVLDEPFYAYYLHQSGVDHPGREAILQAQPIELEEVLHQVESHAQTKHVFIKNMAHHLIMDDVRFLSGYQNLFLIRNPRDLIASFAQVIPNPKMTDIGLARQLELYDRLSQEQHCPVIDSGEVLKDPEGVLRQLCPELQLAFDANMLSWKAGAIADDGVWAPYWYANVHRSTGFQQPNTQERPLPPHCEDLYQQALAIYQNLFQHAIKAKPL